MIHHADGGFVGCNPCAWQSYLAAATAAAAATTTTTRTTKRATAAAAATRSLRISHPASVVASALGSHQGALFQLTAIVCCTLFHSFARASPLQPLLRLKQSPTNYQGYCFVPNHAHFFQMAQLTRPSGRVFHFFQAKVWSLAAASKHTHQPSNFERLNLSTNRNMEWQAGRSQRVPGLA